MTTKNISWLAQLDIVKQLPVVRLFVGSFIIGYAVWCLSELTYLTGMNELSSIWQIELLIFGAAWYGANMIMHAVWADLRETDD